MPSALGMLWLSLRVSAYEEEKQPILFQKNSVETIHSVYAHADNLPLNPPGSEDTMRIN